MLERLVVGGLERGNDGDDHPREEIHAAACKSPQRPGRVEQETTSVRSFRLAEFRSLVTGFNQMHLTITGRTVVNILIKCDAYA